MSFAENFDMPIDLEESLCSEERTECRRNRLVCFGEYIKSTDADALPAEPEGLDTGERA